MSNNDKSEIAHLIEPEKDEVSVLKVTEDGITFYHVHLLRKDGEKGRKICGHPKKGTPDVLLRDKIYKDLICLKKAGLGTIHVGEGFCANHERFRNKSSIGSFISMQKMYARNSTLEHALEDIEHVDIKVEDAADEIRFLSALLLEIMEMVREGNKGKYGRDEINMLRMIVKDIVNAKEAASRIQTSNKLQMTDVREVVEQIMTFLMKELYELQIPREVVGNLVKKMSTEVFIPLTNRQMLNDNIGDLDLGGRKKL